MDTTLVKGAIEAADGELSGRGRVLVRASGTEPLIRVMVEAPTQEETDDVCAELARAVEGARRPSDPRLRGLRRAHRARSNIRMSFVASGLGGRGLPRAPSRPASRLGFMCGIVGYVGPRQVRPLLFDGLKKLEYRGYDSAGISVLDGDGIDLVRAVGNLSQLRAAIDEREAAGRRPRAHTPSRRR